MARTVETVDGKYIREDMIVWVSANEDGYGVNVMLVSGDTQQLHFDDVKKQAAFVAKWEDD